MQLQVTNQLFFDANNLPQTKVEELVNQALHGLDDGECFFEYTENENLTFDDNQLKNASNDIAKGFGLRGISGEATAYAHASECTLAALQSAVSAVKSLAKKTINLNDATSPQANKRDLLYIEKNPLRAADFLKKKELVEAIDAYIRAQEPRMRQVTVSLGGEWQAIHIVRKNSEHHADIRPLVRLNISVVIEEHGRMERGSYGFGGRYSYEQFFDEATWKNAANEAIRQAKIALQAKPVKAGEMDVVLGNGWPGVLLHEAIGHGLEGDFNRKETSAFSGLMGTRIAAEGVTVVDDGTLPNRRGSLNIDDEGTPTSCTTLIEDGILVGFMQDRQW
jgi:TldD protein